jgi:hypothetical protein
MLKSSNPPVSESPYAAGNSRAPARAILQGFVLVSRLLNLGEAPFLIGGTAVCDRQ